MSMFPGSGAQRKPWELEYGAYERPMARFFNTVYAWMAVGLALTATVAWFVAPHLPQLIGRSLGLLVICGIAAFVISIGVQRSFRRLNANVATALFLLFAAIIGVFISNIFLIYSPTVLISAFGVTGGVFVGMSVYGFVTKRDLSRIGAVLVMCVWGLLLASVVNYFVASNAFDWLITYGVLAAFIGITAYKTQELKLM